MSCCAVIVNYHTERFLPRLVQSLIQAPEVTEIVIVDNSHQLNGNRTFPLSECRIICNDHNRGFAAAVNQGVAVATTEWILTVNPDLHLKSGAVRYMIQAAQAHRTVLAGPRFFLDDACSFRIPPATGGCLWLDLANRVSAQHQLDMTLHSFYWTLRHDRFWQAIDPFFEPFLSGACMLVHRDWLERSGGWLFDERFFMYFEDTDLCARVMDAGFSPVCAPAAYAVHYYDQAQDNNLKKTDFMVASHQLFYEKHYGQCPPAHASSTAMISYPNMESLGELEQAPIFDVPTERTDSPLYFELGVNPWFVPFAQALYTGERFVFPRDIWNKLAPGEYFGRIRRRSMNQLKLLRWKKV